MKYLDIFKKSILAGIMIAIGGTVYLSLDNKIAGALLFSIGLYGVLINNLYLFTGKIGYLLENFNLKYIFTLLITLFGNFIGSFLVGFVLKYTKVFNNLNLVATNIVNSKINSGYLSAFILSFFCGLLMYYAVDGYKKIKDGGKYLPVLLGVSVFILCGFEHSIANMYYFTVAESWSGKAILVILIMVLGNTLGSFVIPFLRGKELS